MKLELATDDILTICAAFLKGVTLSRIRLTESGWAEIMLFISDDTSDRALASLRLFGIQEEQSIPVRLKIGPITDDQVAFLLEFERAQPLDGQLVCMDGMSFHLNLLKFLQTRYPAFFAKLPYPFHVTNVEILEDTFQVEVGMD